MASYDSEDIGKLLSAEYFYKYKTNNGQLITINIGEEYILIKKSNADWWQVIQPDQKKPFYVPAAYMKELDKRIYPDHAFFRKAYSKLQKDKKKLRLSGDTKSETDRQSPLLTREKDYKSGSRENLSDLSSKSKYSFLRASCDSLDRFIENENPYDEVPFESKVSMPHEHHTTKGYKITSKSQEFPDYENLENIQTHIAESRQRTSPATESKLATQPRDQQLSNLESKSQNVVVYANIGETLHSNDSHPRLPVDPSSSTTSTAVEVLDDGWEQQLDNQSNSKYYLNKLTGEMRTEPPRRSANSPTTAKHLIKKISADRIVPPAPPDVSKKPTLHRSRISEPSSPLERRKTSPARLDGNSDLPEIVDQDEDQPEEPKITDFVISKSLLKPSHIEPLKDTSSDNVVGRQRSFRERFFPDLEKKKNKHKKANSVSSSYSLTKSPVTSPKTSPKVAKEIIVHPQNVAGWTTERNTDGNVIHIRKSNGERWQQMLDNNTGKFYYYNESTNKTSWQLPDELQSREDTSFPADINKAEVTEDDLALIEKSSYVSDNSMRKASTLERDTFPPTKKDKSLPHSGSLPHDTVPPQVSVKPRKDFKRHVNRVMVAQSMIILPDARSDRPTCEDSSQLEKSRLRHKFDSSPLPHPLIERKGKLNWTKLMEAGKKQRKNWIQQWVVLLANNLLFYKDEKQATMTKNAPHGKPESSCELRGATVDWANEKSSKRNVIELQTVRGLSLLLQHEDQPTIQRWLIAINAAIERANQIEGDDLVFKPPLIIDEEEDNDGKKKKDKKKKKPIRHSSDAKNNENVRTRLRKYLSRRPTIESLQERGIIKETVFGCPLEKLCEKENSTVPQFVRLCVEEVERRGLDIDGIYRVSGNLSHVQKLRYLVDRDEALDLSEIQWDDIHLITGALKMFLRELPEPVIPFNFFDKFITACKIQNDSERIEAMRALVSVLPRVNAATLRYLMKHFCKVVEHSSKNRMHVQNIAIVFGPTLLLKPPDESVLEVPGGSHMAVYMVYQNQIIDEMLTQYDRIFG